MRRFLLLPLAAFLLLRAASGASAADEVVFQLGWLPGGDRAHVYVGTKEGLFAKENLEVKILTGRGATDVITKLSTGVADFGEAGLDAVLAAKAAGPTPVTAVMPYFVKQPDALLTTTSTGLKTIKDAVGRKIATSPFTSSNIAWPYVLRVNDVDPQAVGLIKADAGVLGSMLASGQVDAILSWVTSTPPIDKMVKEAGKSLHVVAWADFGFEGYSQSIVASDKTLTTRPDVTRRFLKVFRQCVEFMRDHPQQAADDLLAMVPALDPVAVRAQVDVAVKLAMNEISARDGLGVFEPGRVRKTWEWVSSANGFAPDKLDPLQSIDPKSSGS